MKLPLVSVPNETLGWSGGDAYLTNLKLALGELQDEKRIKILPKHQDWLVERYPFRPSARMTNDFEISQNLSNVAFLPWAPIRRLPRPLIWIPDLQDKDLPLMFPRSEVKSRDRSRRIAILKKASFYFSSRTMERRFIEIYPKAVSVGIVRFAFKNLTPSGSISKLNLELDNGFFYAPNQFWKHKNHLTLLEAFRRYRESGGTQDLVLSGSTLDPRWPNHSNDILRIASETEGVHSLGFIPRSYQMNLYSTSSAVIQPSLYEGWSSSVEEALSFGLRVISADIPVLREQNQDIEGVRFFHPLDSDSLSQLMHETPPPTSIRTREIGGARWTRFKSDLHEMITNYLH
jgi:glycosyltransferase involved in cell wall biosynthesis